jgi:Icc-related predicted phosphoesterase
VARTRIYFISDVHASERCWLKFPAPKFYDADTVIIGGDITGKFIVPIRAQANGNWLVENFLGRSWKVKTRDELVVLAEIALAIFAYTTLVEILSGFLGFAISFLVVCLAGVFFPFTHRQTMERSPANIKVAGIPLMTICGVIAAPFLGFIAYRTAVDKALGANAHISLIVNGILIVIGFGWFYALRWYRRHRGEDVDRRFKEIPIE